MPSPRWAHQQKALDFSHDKSAIMYAMGMGTGKSRVANDLIVQRKAAFVLFV